MNRKRQINRSNDKYDYWNVVRLITAEYKAANPDCELSEWISTKYGIMIDTTADGMYEASYTIINEVLLS